MYIKIKFKKIQKNSVRKNISAVQQTFFSTLFQAYVGWFAVFLNSIYVAKASATFFILVWLCYLYRVASMKANIKELLWSALIDIDHAPSTVAVASTDSEAHGISLLIAVPGSISTVARQYGIVYISQDQCQSEFDQNPLVNFLYLVFLNGADDNQTQLPSLGLSFPSAQNTLITGGTFVSLP